MYNCTSNKKIEWKNKEKIIDVACGTLHAAMIEAVPNSIASMNISPPPIPRRYAFGSGSAGQLGDSSFSDDVRYNPTTMRCQKVNNLYYSLFVMLLIIFVFLIKNSGIWNRLLQYNVLLWCPTQWHDNQSDKNVRWLFPRLLWHMFFKRNLRRTR